MSRKSITGEMGEFLGWFDDCSCKAVFEENTYFNGHNHISKATGSQWIHETLYFTAKGSWVIMHSGNVKPLIQKSTKHKRRNGLCKMTRTITKTFQSIYSKSWIPMNYERW